MTNFLGSKANVSISDTLTASDVVRLQNYLLKKGTLSESNAKKYDLDNSQTLNAKDLSLLKKRVRG